MVTHQHSDSPDPGQICHLDEWWLDGVLRAIESLARSGAIFTTDDLRRDPYSLPEPPHPNHWGAAFAKARADGIIKPVGYASSRTVSRNGGVLRLWRSAAPRVVAA